ncbi:hypothetical protein DFO61_3355 [Ectopseudomonas oleovorans]|uniref:DUF7210 domain-containing protein n=1 Tax=Ectopseudomonas oleovorans TaxID=301 RepID=A0A397MK06_ECTOL|nr:hypothetical protein [Pseudomonas oleovorans]RIA22665.1 hypothetical protein DFO61_3355 [Pseudomonas oleovorans]
MTSKTAVAPTAAPGGEEPERPLVEVTLNGPHTHKGKPCAKGDKIKVTEERKIWLERQGKVGDQGVSND